MNKVFGNKMAIFLFSFPALLIFTVFAVYPIFPEIYISFFKHNGFEFEKFLGIGNYASILTDARFWRSSLNTYFIVACQLLIGMPISILLALVIDKKAKVAIGFFKISSFIPAVLSVTVLAQMWIAIYQPTWGLLNTALKAVGLETLTRVWLVNKATALGAVTFGYLWQYVGFNMMIIYTGIKVIPDTYYEAATIEGANFLQTSWHITIPLIQEIIKFVTISSFLGCMGQFAHIKIMTGGGPGDLTRTIIYTMYHTAFNNWEFGKGCSIAIIYILQCLAFTLMINRYMAKERVEF